MTGFAIRNLKIFFKDRSSVFFSLLAVFIIIGLYVLFLGNLWTNNFGSEAVGVRFLMDSWIMAGLLAVTSVTTTMGAFGIMVEDRAQKIVKDFYASPIPKSSIVGGYILSAFLIGIIMSAITAALAEIYIVADGGKIMGWLTLLKVLALILLSTLANSSLVLFLVSFFSSTNAFATASTIIGTLIGFLTGIYLPIGNLPSSVQWAVKLFPVSHSAALFRQVMMETPMSVTFKGVPTEMVTSFEQFAGVRCWFGGDTAITPLTSILVLILTAVVFYSLALMNISRKMR
jgi:multidrug/hemolysin transport system permease protein